MTGEVQRRTDIGFGPEKQNISPDEEYFDFQRKLSEEAEAVDEYGRDLTGEGGDAERHFSRGGYGPSRILMFLLVLALALYLSEPFLRVQGPSMPPPKKANRGMKSSAETLLVEGRVVFSDGRKPEKSGSGFIFRGFGIILKFGKSDPAPIRIEPVVGRDGFFREEIPLPRELWGISRIEFVYAEREGYGTRVFPDVKVRGGAVRLGEVEMKIDTTWRGRNKGRCQ